MHSVTAADVRALLAEDAFVRHTLVPGNFERVEAAYATTAAAGWVSHRHGRKVLTVVGDPADVPTIVRAARAADPDLGAATVPRAALDRLGPEAPQRPNLWDWFITDEPPPVRAGEERVELATAADERAIAALLDANSERYSASPGDADIQEWVVIRDPDGSLVAAAAHTQHAPGVPHLASIVTRTDRRGQGLGAAVTAALTRRILAGGAGVVTLGMYADNESARHLYRHLGYRDTHHFASGALPGRPGDRATG